MEKGIACKILCEKLCYMQGNLHLSFYVWTNLSWSLYYWQNKNDIHALHLGLLFFCHFVIWFQGLGIRPGVMDGAISISAVQVCFQYKWLNQTKIRMIPMLNVKNKITEFGQNAYWVNEMIRGIIICE